MAMESVQMVRERQKTEIEGVAQDKTMPVEGMEVYRVRVSNEQGAKAVGKPVGRYVSMDLDKPFDRGTAFLENASREFSVHVRALVNTFKQGDAPVLVIGLGNRDVTPDSLGPRVVERVLVTRHLKGVVPDELVSRLHDVVVFGPITPGIRGGSEGQPVGTGFHGLGHRVSEEVVGLEIPHLGVGAAGVPVLLRFPDEVLGVGQSASDALASLAAHHDAVPGKIQASRSRLPERTQKAYGDL